MCGFTDLKKAGNEYVCRICFARFQAANFRELVRLTLGERVAKQLDKQCQER